ncbi:DUF2057 family protein [Aeromonas sp. 164P]
MKQHLLIAALATLPAVSFAAVDLDVGRGMEVLAVNGIPVDSPLFIGKVDALQLPDGTNQIAVRAGQLVKDYNTTKKFTSHVHVLTFTANNQRVAVTAPVLATWQAGEQFNEQPRWQLSSNGQTLPHQFGELKSMTNMALLRNYGAELDAFNRSNQPAALASLAGVLQQNSNNMYNVQPAVTQAVNTVASAVQPAAPTAVVEPVKAAAPQAAPAKSPAAALTANEQTRAWFSQLTPAEKRDFISWAAQNL